MRLDMTPGNNMDFVTGMKHLVNREQILKAVVRGVGEIGNDQPLPRSNPYYNADLAPKAYDPEKAKFHFEKAGVLAQSIHVVAADAATLSVEMATLLQQSGAEISLTLDIQRVPSDGYWSNYWLKAPFHFGNINTRPTADAFFSLLNASNAAWNESQYKKNAHFDELLLQARGMLDDAKRKEIYGEMQVMVAEDAGTIIPTYMANIDAMSSKIKGMIPNGLGNTMGFNYAGYIWLDE